MMHYINHDDYVTLQVGGDLERIVADAAYMILITYKELLKNNGCAAEIFRDFFENHSKDIFDFDAAHKKETEDIKSFENCEKDLNDLLNVLESVMKTRKKGGDDNA